jgi:hypothetical protein
MFATENTEITEKNRIALSVFSVNSVAMTL